jgi:hypothetical protein
MATGALFLTITAIFATKANKKFTTIHTAYVVDGATNTSYVVKNSSTVLPLTTIQPSGGHQLLFYVNGSSLVGGIYTGTSDSDKKIYK